MSSRGLDSNRYSYLEREQRWAVFALPPGATLAGGIYDRYIDGTRLRLRRINTNGELIFKLAHKVRATENDPETVSLTNCYLSKAEYDVIATLPASELWKSRWHVDWLGKRLAIDEFHRRHDGLLLAEAELGVDEDLLPQPPFAALEVTRDNRFTGGALATASDDDIRRLLEVIA